MKSQLYFQKPSTTVLFFFSFFLSAKELKEHEFFKDMDWNQVYQLRYPPPLIPPRGEVNAADAFDIGSFDEDDTKGIKVWLVLNLRILFKNILYSFFLY